MENVLALVREGKIEEAEAAFNQRQAEGAGPAECHYGRGVLFEAKGQVEEAIEAFQAARELDQDHVEATFHLARALDLYCDDEKAEELYESLAERTPTYVHALLNLAVLYEDEGRYPEARACVERVLSEHPNHTRARLFRKDIESAMNMHYDEAQERSQEQRDAILDAPVSDFELSVRSRNCLRKMNIHTLGDLLRISEAELLSYKNFGETSLHEIKVMLEQRNLRIGQLKEESPQASRSAPLRHPAPAGAPEVLNRFLSEIEFSGRSRRCLQRLGLVTVNDLVIKSEAELLAVKNFGQTSLNEIKQKLAEVGLTLRK